MLGYKKLFWGFIFLFDFRIQGIDILPDIVAYVFFYQGLSVLSERNEHFAKAKNLALPLIFISILDIYQKPVPIDQVSTGFPLFSVVFAIIFTIINMMMVYGICMGIVEEARVINDIELESKAVSRWKLYLTANVAIFISILFAGLLGILFFLVLILSFVSYILMITLMTMASNRLR